MGKRDYYEVLGVARDAGADEIKKAYRRLAMKNHPDRNPDDEAAHGRFTEAQEAYAVLSDESKRSAYDRFGHSGVSQSAGGRGGADFSDIFGDVFGDIFGGGRRRQRASRGSDMRFALELDLVDAVRGCEKEIRIPTRVSCRKCKGTGSADGKRSTCITCNGVGQVRMQQGIFSVQQTCPHCGGSGQRIQHPCGECHGEGRRRDTRTLSVKIPAGVDDGDRIRLAGEGEAAPNAGTAGDLYIEVHLKPHPLFKRDGDDLYCEIPIHFATAALGGQVEVPTLSGSVMLKVPPETQTGKLFKLRAKGVKSVRSYGPGDLLCRVLVETPVKLNGAQKQLLREFESSLAGNRKQQTPMAERWVEGVKRFFGSVTN